jgi:hypothetical protein
MAKNLQVGEIVFVPLNRLGVDRVGVSAFLRTTVLAVDRRTVMVDLLDGGMTANVASSAVHRNVGVCIFAIGDIDSESTLIEPLRKSVLQYCRLLLPEGSLFLHAVRSVAELRKFWQRDHALCSHVILVGHASTRGLNFAVDGVITPRAVGALFAEGNAGAKHYLSLCCQTGKRDFAAPFSAAANCETLTAPYHAVHGAIASQFLQNYLGHHFLDGRSAKVAYNKAQAEIPSGVKFRFWSRGLLQQ